LPSGGEFDVAQPATRFEESIRHFQRDSHGVQISRPKN
jgi:hypothetical protein